jgi:hypothetical protein
VAQQGKPDELVTLQELAFSNAYEIADLLAVLERKGLLTQAEVLEEIRRAVDPYENVLSKNSLGGPSPQQVQKMVSEAQAKLRTQSEWLEKEIRRVEQAYQEMASQEAKLLRAV